MRFLFAVVLWAGAVQADPVADVVAAARLAFAGMPELSRVDEITGICGADDTVNQEVVYCTTRNVIFVAQDAYDLPSAPYQVAHAYGHAVQVQHGVADFALAQIRNRRDEEDMLRGLVARQVECIAGFLMSRAKTPQSDLTAWFAEEPFDGIHWGRDPLRFGPQVSIGLDARAQWFAIGQDGDLSACAPGEFSANLLIDALQP